MPDDDDRPTIYFTPAEANALLPDLVGRMSGVAERVRRARSLTETLRAGDDPDERTPSMIELDELRAEIERMIEEFRDDGVEVKGVSPGLLDFPAVFNGQPVYLCWKEGEDRVEWWHPMSTGIAGRQRVDPKRLGQWEWCN